MNVLFFSFWYPSSENPLKGIFIKEHAAAIKSAGNNIEVFFFNIAKGNSIYKKSSQKFIDENGITTHELIISSRFNKALYISLPLLYIIVARYYKRNILPEFKPEILHSNILNPCAIIGDRLAKKYHLPHVITEHWSKVDKFIKKNIFGKKGIAAYNDAKAITVVSGYLKSNISKYIKDKSKIEIVPNVIDTNIFNYKIKADSENIVFTAVATWELPKNPGVLVKGLEEVQKSQSKKIILNFIGEGSLLHPIRKEKHSFEINYLGVRSKKDIAKILHESDYFLHASEIETFSIVTAEALCTGTPAIVSNKGALPELINPGNGILTENSTVKWAQSIKKAINTNYNHRQISLNAANRYTGEVIGKSFSKIYNLFSKT